MIISNKIGTKVTKEGWYKIGEVGVDSGQLLITDPCYIDSEWKQEKEDTEIGDAKEKFSYNACSKIHLTGNEKADGQLFYKRGHAGVGVTFGSGFGDGLYGVYAYYKKYDGEEYYRTSQVTILLITEENEDIAKQLGLIQR